MKIRDICISKYFFLSIVGLLLSNIVNAQNTQDYGQAAPGWLYRNASSKTVGIGIAPYTSFKPSKGWDKAIRRGIQDLNANYSMIVYSYGYQVGRGPLRLRSNFAIRTLLDSTNIAVTDSALWKGKAFVQLKSKKTLGDSVLYPENEAASVTDQILNNKEVSEKPEDNAWLKYWGTASRVESNWNLSVSKAKQDALRKLAEKLSVEVSAETYAVDGTSRRYYNFQTMIAFQRVQVLRRLFTKDSLEVQIAVGRKDIRMLME